MPILSHHLNVTVNAIVERMYNEITRSELMVSPDPGGVLTFYLFFFGLWEETEAARGSARKHGESV